MAAHTLEKTFEVRYRDLDSLGHVNNAVYATYLEEVRTEYLETVIGEPPTTPGVVIASVEINYERPIRFGESVTVGMHTSDIGTASITMAYEVLVEGNRAATAETVMVPFDREAGSSQPVPEEWRDRIESHEGTTF